MLTTRREQLITGIAQTEKVIRMFDAEDAYAIDDFLTRGRVLLNTLRLTSDPLPQDLADEMTKELQEWHVSVMMYWQTKRTQPKR